MKYVKQTYQIVELDGLTDRLKEHPQNPNRGNTAAIGASMEVNGFFGAVLAQESTGYILAGNHTFRTAVRKEAKEIPVLWVDVDDETALRILLADNKIAALGHMDEEALDAILSALPDLEGTGYGLEAVQEFEENGGPESASGEQAAIEVPDEEFESQFGVVVLCEDADHQQRVYEFIRAESDAGNYPDGRIELRVVAI